MLEFIDETVENIKSNQVLVTNISWKNESTKQYVTKKDFNAILPLGFTLDIPENVLVNARKPENNFNDIIETFVYNFLTHKYFHEVCHCQIYLPLENEKNA